MFGLISTSCRRQMGVCVPTCEQVVEQLKKLSARKSFVR